MEWSISPKMRAFVDVIHVGDDYDDDDGDGGGDDNGEERR